MPISKMLTEVDPSDLPLTDADLQRMKRTARVAIIRRAQGLTQEAFAKRYGIPLGTLRDWEQGRSEPDQPSRAYLRVIATMPEFVADIIASSLSQKSSLQQQTKNSLLGMALKSPDIVSYTGVTKFVRYKGYWSQEWRNYPFVTGEAA
jgi:DNA-binding transcriptional regulator YiaG